MPLITFNNLYDEKKIKKPVKSKQTFSMALLCYFSTYQMEAA